MIFVCVGSREYQFDRLLKKIDELIEKKQITDEVFAQIGQSTYLPKNYKYVRYMSRDDFRKYQRQAELVISHGGTGALIGALKMGKQVVAVPRLYEFGEHIDDHQTQVAGVLAEEGYLRCVNEIDELGEVILKFSKSPITKKYNKPSRVLDIIEEFIKVNT